MIDRAKFDKNLEAFSDVELQAMVAVGIRRDPAATVVFIDGVQVPQGVESLQLPSGRHTLRVSIRGKGGDKGTGAVVRGDLPLCAETATIPAGFDHAYSGEGVFNV